MDGTLEKPVVSAQSIRSVNFFNGRMLTAEDMNREKAANREGHKQLGRASGAGVAYGLEVLAIDTQAASQPAIVIRPGLAVNRRGKVLELFETVTLALKKPPEARPVGGPVSFDDCAPPQDGVYIVGEGVYLLTLGPAELDEGRAPSNRLASDPACAIRYKVEAVQFRLRPLTDFLQAEVGDHLTALRAVADPNELPAARLQQRHLLRNRVAYRCFGAADSRLLALRTTPLSGPPVAYGLLDDLHPQLTACEVPLAVIFWTALGIEFVDRWAVRRRLTGRNAIAGGLTDRLAAEAEAMVLQFQDALADLSSVDVAAAEVFRFLPPAGYLPMEAGHPERWRTFLGPLAPARPTPVDAGLMDGLVQRALTTEGVGVSSDAAMAVYQDPAQPGFALFARAELGRLRAVFQPPVVDELPFDLVAHSVDANTQLDFGLIEATEAKATYGVDVSPGEYTVVVTAPDYFPIAPITTRAVGGRIADLPVVALELLPNGVLVLTILDLTGANVASRVSRVTATSGDGSVSREGALGESRTTWQVGDLPPGAYSVTIVASGFQILTVANVAIARGQRLQQTVALVPVPRRQQPDLCVGVSRFERLALEKVRLCMVLKATEFTGRFFGGQYVSKALTQRDFGLLELDAAFGGARGVASAPLATARVAAIASSGWVDEALRFAPEAVPSRYIFEKPGRVRFPKISDGPWSAMQRFEPLPTNVQEWLADWQAWFDEDMPGQGIGRAVPAIFFDPNYRPPQRAEAVRAKPPAYAVFGDFGVPLSMTVSSSITKLPVGIDKMPLLGIGDRKIYELEKAGIDAIDQLPGMWSDFLDEALDQAPDDSRYLVDDSRRSAEQIVQKRGYLDGVDDAVLAKLAQLGLNDDVALANADFQALSDVLGSQGFANRLIGQARQVVAPSSWSLGALGLDNGQIKNLNSRGITSMGEFAGKANRPEARAALVEAVGSDVQVQALGAAAFAQLAAASVQEAPSVAIHTLGAVADDPSLAGKLADAGLLSANEIARTSADDLAGRLGIDVAVAGRLIGDAQHAGTAGADVGMIAAIDPAAAQALKDNGIATVGALTQANAATVAAAFGGNASVANALITSLSGALRLRRIG